VKKLQLIDMLAERTNTSKAVVSDFLEAFLDTVKETLSKGDEIVLTGFGKFSVSDRAARKGLNPRTKEEIDIPARKVPAFKAGKELKDAVNSRADV